MLNVGVTIDTVFQGVGCDKCRQSGYRGRMGIYEVLELSDAIEPLVLARASSSSIFEIPFCRDSYPSRE